MKVYFKQCAVLIGLATIFCVGSTSFSCAAPLEITAEKIGSKILGVENSSPAKIEIMQMLEVGRLDHIPLKDTEGMMAFYEAHSFEPVWLQSSFLQPPKSEKILQVFEESWKHGLNPASYHVEDIRRLMDAPKDAERFQLDLLLSDALVRYGQDLTGMRVNPKSIGQLSKYWRTPMRGVDILDHVANANNVVEALRGLEPQGMLYKKLQAELVAILNSNEISPENPISISGIIRPGAKNKAVLSIRERMGFKAENAPQGAYVYDDQLAKAVMAFQQANGLTPDGIVGAHTVKLMNITRQDRINQILVNLERLRWVEPNKPSRYVMVNVPAAMLWAVEDGQVKLEMPVVVGRAERPTNIFTTTITGIRFNPTWTVPPTIKRDDYLPKLQNDPYYLSDRGIELVDSNNMTVDPGLVDWKSKTWGEVNQMRMVQGSGANNPLGLVRVIMDNPYNIYLHDTPTKSYFSRANRALSSGCVRMAEPQKLADFVLSPNIGWSSDKKQEILARGKQTEIRAEQPMPVYILYQTVWLGQNGQIVYGPDLYGNDVKLLNELKKMDGIVFPVTGSLTKTALNADVIDG